MGQSFISTSLLLIIRGSHEDEMTNRLQLFCLHFVLQLPRVHLGVTTTLIETRIERHLQQNNQLREYLNSLCIDAPGEDGYYIFTCQNQCLLFCAFSRCRTNKRLSYLILSAFTLEQAHFCFSCRPCPSR